MSKTRIGLGDWAKDMITGYEGIVQARYEYLTGCVRLDIQAPGITADGKLREPYVFDESRCEYIRPGLTDRQMEQIVDVGGPEQGTRPIVYADPNR